MKKLLLTLVLAAMAALAHAQGTITFGNSTLTRVQIRQHDGSLINVPTTVAIHYGVFVNGTLVEPLGLSSTTSAGIIVAPNPYPIPGTQPGQTVSMQIRGWSAGLGAGEAFYFGETDVRQVTLGPTAGPGTVIWQTASSTNPNRFYSLVLVPEPSTILLGVLGGLFWVLRRARRQTTAGVEPGAF